MTKQIIANGLNGVWFVLIVVGLALGSEYMIHTEYWQKALVAISAGILSFLPQWGFNQIQPEAHQTAKSTNKEVLTAWLWGGVAAVFCLIPLKNWVPVWVTGIGLIPLALILHGGIFKIFKKNG